jgi:hypothetical protein
LKKGRHRRFEEARKLKQAGPGAFVGSAPRPQSDSNADDDESYYEALAEKYGAFDDEDDDTEDTDD